ASTRKNAGKTSIIIGLAKALGKKVGYIKPFGDRQVYQKKRLWDSDAALITNIFGLEYTPEEMTLGFDHSKLQYIYDDKTELEKKLIEIADNSSKDKELLFIEGGNDLAYGLSVHLDSLTVAQTLGAKLLLVVFGNYDKIYDDLVFVKDYISQKGVDLIGVIINKVRDLSEFQETYLEKIKNLGIKVLGVIPHRPELTHVSVDYIYQKLFAKIIAGDRGIDKQVKNIFVGAMSANMAVRSPLFDKEGKLIITSGDRSDMILAAIESNTSGIILTNNILPEDPIILSKATASDIPILLVREDTFTTAKLIDDMEILFTHKETGKIALLEHLVKEYVEITKLI
ncbi:MAG: DRTGG domain-containing protein, partial [Candidatus Hodarchaeota archaeon]